MSDPHDSAGTAFERDRPRLLRMVEVRLPAALQGRIGAADVVQEVFLEASRRIAERTRDEAMPMFLWLRLLTRQKLDELCRRHLGAQARDARREGFGDSELLADRLVGHVTSPSAAAMRGELRDRLRAALEGLEPRDREILVLRHFEQLGSVEAARELGLERSAASKRYVRALQRLRSVLDPLG